MKHKHNRQKGKVQASQKNFKENIFHHVMQVDAYTLKKGHSKKFNSKEFLFQKTYAVQ